MAHFKSISAIKNQMHMYRAIDYVTLESKLFRASYVNCSKGNSFEVSKQFEYTRMFYQKNDKILAHHFEQSFAPNDNVTPEQAFEIAQKLVDKIAPGFQAIIATHIDTDKIHTHIIINSVSMITGAKLQENKDFIRFARSESDKLCKQYKLSVIEKKKRAKGVDQVTYQLGVRGKSWKVNLCGDLDEALKVCKTKEEFIKFFESKDYTIKYKDIHITFQKKGEKKGIRADTLAKQFGNKYCKASIDKILNVTPKITKEEYIQQNKKKKKRASQNINYKNEYEKLEDWHFKNNPPMNFGQQENWTINKELFLINPLNFVLRLLKHLFLKNGKHMYNKKRKCSYPKQPLKQAVSTNDIYACKSNISYKSLKSAPGETSQIKIYAWQLPKLLSQSFFYYSFINVNTGIATVYLKDKDLVKLSKALELTDDRFFVKQAEQLKNRKMYQKLKKENNKLSYIVVDNSQLKILRDNYIQFAYFEKENKYNIAFSPPDKKYIIKLLYPERFQDEPQIKKETSYQRNGRINAELKAEAEKTGDRVCYKIVSSTQLHYLNKAGNVKFASFRTKDGKNNICFLGCDRKKIENIIFQSELKNTNNSESAVTTVPKNGQSL